MWEVLGSNQIEWDKNVMLLHSMKLLQDDLVK